MYVKTEPYIESGADPARLQKDLSRDVNKLNEISGVNADWGLWIRYTQRMLAARFSVKELSLMEARDLTIFIDRWLDHFNNSRPNSYRFESPGSAQFVVNNAIVDFVMVYDPKFRETPDYQAFSEGRRISQEYKDQLFVLRDTANRL